MNKKKLLWLSQAITKYYKKKRPFIKGQINLIPAPAGSGKSHFIINELLIYPQNYLKDYKSLHKVIFLVDTNNLGASTINDITVAMDKENEIIGDKVSKTHARGTVAYLKQVSEYISNSTLRNVQVMSYNSFSDKVAEGQYLDLQDSLIIADELQNLFNYVPYSSTNNYSLLISQLNTLSKANWFIGLSATYEDIFDSYLIKQFKVKIKTLDKIEQNIDKLISYNFNPIVVNSMDNVIQLYDFGAMKKKGNQAFIGTRKIVDEIKIAEEINERFPSLKVVWLCSPNAKEWASWCKLEEHLIKTYGMELLDQDINLSEKYNLIRLYFEEHKTEQKNFKILGTDYKFRLRNNVLQWETNIPVMSNYQFEVLETVIKKHYIPEDIDILICNLSLETGINIENLRDQEGNLIYNRIQTVAVDLTKFTRDYQTRFRVRHDIQDFYIVSHNYELDQDGNYYAIETFKPNANISMDYKQHLEENMLTKTNKKGAIIKYYKFVNFRGQRYIVQDNLPIILDQAKRFVGVPLSNDHKSMLQQIYEKVKPLEGTALKNTSQGLFKHFIKKGFVVVRSKIKSNGKYKFSNKDSVPMLLYKHEEINVFEQLEVINLLKDKINLKLSDQETKKLCKLLHTDKDIKLINSRLKELYLPYKVKSMPIHGKRYYIVTNL